MNATAIRDERQTTLPVDVAEAAGLQPGDQVEWRFEGGEIHGRKLQTRTVPAMTKAEALRALEASPLCFTADWNQLREETR